MKKLIAFVLASLMISAIIPMSASAVTDATYDVNGDGKVNVFDCMIVKSIYFGSTSISDDAVARADVNGDGKVNVFDYMAVKMVYFAESDEIPGDTARDIDFTAHNLLGAIEGVEQGYNYVYGRELQAFVVTDYDELNELLKDYNDYGNSSNQSRYYFDDFVGTLPEDYFDENALVVTPFNTPTLGEQLTVENVSVDGEAIVVELSVTSYGIAPDAVEEYLITTEIKKSDIGEIKTARTIVCECTIGCYGYKLFKGSNPLTDEGDLTTKLVTDYEQLSEIVEACDPLAIKGLDEFAESLSEDYFDTYALILTGISGPSGSENFEVYGATRDEDSLTVSIYRWTYPNTDGDCEQISAIVVTVVNKSDIGDVTNVISEYRELG